MKKIFVLVLFVLFSVQSYAGEINAESLNLTAEQNSKLLELKEGLKSEIQPIWEEIENNKQRISEIERKYFEEFWKMLTDEQREEFSKLNK